MKRKLLCLLLAVLMILPLFTACSKDGKEIDIVSKGASAYTIILPENKEEGDAAIKLWKAIEKQTGVTLPYAEDIFSSTDQPKSAKEILVGQTNRLASEETLAELRPKDFVIKYVNDRVVILGGSPEATVRAVDYFINTYIDGKAQTVSVYQKRADLVEHPYALRDLSVDGVPLSEYTIVFPAGADQANDTTILTYYTALALSDYILANAGIKLKLAPDSKEETEYEILVGHTSREASKAVKDTTLAADEYLLMKSGSKIVMQGNTYMVAGAASALANIYFKSEGPNTDIDLTTLPTAPTPAKFTFEKATSAILMIGDGMGNAHIDATLASGKLKSFVARTLPFEGSCTTASESVLNSKVKYTDSAAAATALATGYKTLNGYLGMDASKTVRQNVRELAHSVGARTGVLTTDAITGATPAGFLCHNDARGDTKILQEQIDQLIENGEIDYCTGDASVLVTPARNALSQLSEGGSRFFMMIEEAHIDKFSHKGPTSMSSMQECVVRYNRCIAYAIAFVMLHPATALIITADHETGGLEKDSDGNYDFTNQTKKDYWQHTNANAPIFALGEGVDALIKADTVIDNTDVAKHIAGIFGSTAFGK